jgi:hypothetical protein
MKTRMGIPTGADSGELDGFWIVGMGDLSSNVSADLIECLAKGLWDVLESL